MNFPELAGEVSSSHHQNLFIEIAKTLLGVIVKLHIMIMKCSPNKIGRVGVIFFSHVFRIKIELYVFSQNAMSFNAYFECTNFIRKTHN